MPPMYSRWRVRCGRYPVGTEQVAFYDWGVGTDRKKMAGGISGVGIDKNIMDCYRFIVHNYDPGDALYFFGFSRGAYTARSLAGFVRNCGCAAARACRRRCRRRFDFTGSAPEAAVARMQNGRSEFRRDYAVADITEIEFVGVWDTVGSLGIPVPFWGTLGEREFLFHDTEPSKIIQHACHAVSIDENRVDFEPTLWSDKPGMDLQQVWFAGVHSDVGGGYAERGLSDCAAQWMIREAGKCGFRFEQHLASAVVPDSEDAQHNERKGIYRARKAFVRPVTGPVHKTVKARWLADAHGYQRKSKALKERLASVNGDWSRIGVVR